MPTTLEKKLRRIRIRCAANVSLDFIARTLTGAGVVVLAAILCQRLAALPVMQPWTVWMLAGACAALVIITSWLNRPTAMQASLLLDERLGLKERCSTALALGRSDDPFALAACQEAHHVVEHLDISRHFPVRPSKRWLHTGSSWALVFSAFFFLPEKDIFGFLRHKQEQQSRQSQVQQT